MVVRVFVFYPDRLGRGFLPWQLSISSAMLSLDPILVCILSPLTDIVDGLQISTPRDVLLLEYTSLFNDINCMAIAQMM